MAYHPMPHRQPHPGSPAAPLPPVVPEASASRESAVSPLGICVTEGESGPVLKLSGEADITTRAQLEEALSVQIAVGVRVLTVDLSELRFADSATIGALSGAARALKALGGQLDLANPQPALSRMLSLLGVDQVLTVRHDADPDPEPEPSAPSLKPSAPSPESTRECRRP